MNAFTIHTQETAGSPADATLRNLESALGFVPNVFAVIAESAPALLACVGLTNHLSRTSLTATEREIVQITTSVENNCGYCVAGHAGHLLELRAAVDERITAGRPLLADFDGAVADLGLDDGRLPLIELGCKLIHVVLDDLRQGIVERVDRLASLEENVRILGRATNDRQIGRQTAGTVGSNQVVVDQSLDIFVSQLFDFVDFVRSTEAVKNVEEGNTGFEGGSLRNQCKVHDLLYRVAEEHAPTGASYSHDI